MFRVNQKSERVYTTKTFRFSRKMMEKVERVAAENNVSTNELVRQCIEYALGDMENGSDGRE